jgi:polyphosphate kinase
MLAIYLNDNTRARIMQPDGTYVRLKPPSEDKAVDVQEWLMKRLNTRKAETI